MKLDIRFMLSLFYRLWVIEDGRKLWLSSNLVLQLPMRPLCCANTISHCSIILSRFITFAKRPPLSFLLVLQFLNILFYLMFDWVLFNVKDFWLYCPFRQMLQTGSPMDLVLSRTCFLVRLPCDSICISSVPLNCNFFVPSINQISYIALNCEKVGETCEFFLILAVGKLVILY